VILTLERTHSEYVSKPEKYVTLAQFELLPNYRFHRHVTGKAVLDAVQGIGNGRVAAFASAPGSAGTLAAGDAIKAIYPDAKIVALEPRECSTLYDGGQGQHRIEGIGDKMVTLIHNVFNSDLLMLIHDEDTVRGMEVLQNGTHVLVGSPGRAQRDRRAVSSARFGPSCVCNVVGAIKTAKYLGLGPEDNVVTIATDSYDRYPSVSQRSMRATAASPATTSWRCGPRASSWAPAWARSSISARRPARAPASDEARSVDEVRLRRRELHQPHGRPGILGRRIRQDQGDRPADRTGARLDLKKMERG
jgi:cysteine synthase A